MNDEHREALIRIVWIDDKLDSIYNDVTEDEFVNRIFKDRDDSLSVEGNSLYYSTFGMSHELLKHLMEYCEENNLRMELNGSKEYEKFTLVIKDVK
jgi:hypothetical protein